jgi:hypothetical protein
MTRRLAGAALCCLAIVAFSAGTRAQGVALTVAAGAVSATDPAPGGAFAAPVYSASFQGSFATYFVLEAELTHWSRNTRTEIGPHDITGPNGVLGRVNGTTIVDSHKFWNAGLNVLVRSTGAVRVFGGAGASLSMDDSEYSQETFGCSPSLDPRLCMPFESARMRGPIPVIRGLGGVEVPVSTRLSLFGAVRLEKTAWEDRRNPISAVAGLRFAVE